MTKQDKIDILNRVIKCTDTGDLSELTYELKNKAKQWLSELEHENKIDTGEIDYDTYIDKNGNYDTKIKYD